MMVCSFVVYLPLIHSIISFFQIIINVYIIISIPPGAGNQIPFSVSAFIFFDVSFRFSTYVSPTGGGVMIFIIWIVF